MNKVSVKNVTLDKKHTEMLEGFKYNEEVLIPKYNSEIERLEKFLNNTKNKKKIDKIDASENKIKELKNTIYKLEKEKKDYFLNNSKYIFDYFEEKKNITSNYIKNQTIGLNIQYTQKQLFVTIYRRIEKEINSIFHCKLLNPFQMSMNFLVVYKYANNYLQ